MTIKIYGSMMAVSTVRTMLTAYERDASDVELEEIRWTALTRKQPEYLAMNPFGMMPFMVDGSLTLFESCAIMRYLAAKFEGQGSEGTRLGGSTPEERALVDQWTEVGSDTLSDPLLKIDHEKIRREFFGLPADETVLKGAMEEIGSVLDVYNSHLARTGNEFLAGNNFTLADLSHLPMLDMLVHDLDMGNFVNNRPYVKVWWDNIQARPCWQKVSENWKNAYNTLRASTEKKEEAS